MSNCSPRKAMGGAMSMPTRNSKGPMRNRFMLMEFTFLAFPAALLLGIFWPTASQRRIAPRRRIAI